MCQGVRNPAASQLVTTVTRPTRHRQLTHTKQRHLMFAINRQLTLLARARTWYVDGTFHVVTQLWSIHAFVRVDDEMKQVPLVFVLMSSRRAEGTLVSLIAVLVPAAAHTAVSGPGRPLFYH